MNDLKSTFFAKAHALGNDFVLIKTNEIFSCEKVKLIANPKLGIGADQILTITCDHSVHIWNSDGSVAKMCGNGLRALGKWILQNLENENFVDCNFDKNTKILELNTISGNVTLKEIEAEIQLTMPKMAEIIEQENCNNSLRGFQVDVGNLHKIFVLEKNPDNFAQYAHENYNVSCIWFENDVCHARTWEIGAAETFACGSAAFAIASVLHYKLGLDSTKLNVHFKYGVIKHDLENGNIVQVGPATIVADGFLYL